MTAAGVLFHAYLRLLEATCQVEVQNFPVLAEGRVLLGFWHGDSFSMNLLLRRIAGMGRSVCVIVTADRRGDTIADLIGKRGGSALRMKDGWGIREGMDRLQTAVCEPTNVFACALDGPLGPEHEPKKLGAYLAEKGDRRLAVCRAEYSRAVRLRRWDHYAVPLPFSTIRLTLRDFGPVDRERLRNYPAWKAELQGWASPLGKR